MGGSCTAYENLDEGQRAMADSPDLEVRLLAVEKGLGMDKLIDDENATVRAMVARRGYGLDRLVFDRAIGVRQAVAAQGFGLDALCEDPSPAVRWIAKESLEESGCSMIEEWVERNPDKRACPQTR